MIAAIFLTLSSGAYGPLTYPATGQLCPKVREGEDLGGLATMPIEDVLRADPAMIQWCRNTRQTILHKERAKRLGIKPND